MKIISHNSWTFNKPKSWWMKVINFTAKCQDVDIKTQYEKYGIRAFDLRVRFENNLIKVVHGYIVYDVSSSDLFKDLQYLNDKGDCVVRLLHDVRSKKQYTTSPVERFVEYAQYYETMFPNIKFFGGNNLYTTNRDYNFPNRYSINGKYGSVISPTWLFGLYPRLYAFFNNIRNITSETDKDYTMIDFVNYN